MKRAAIALGALALCAGCGHGATTYAPQLRAWGELTLRYDDGFTMSAEGKEVASGVSWGGLTDYVSCVPKAKEHAEAAESAGAAALGLSWSGAGIGLLSLGSLGGLSLWDDKDKAKQEQAAYILLGGLGAAVTGVILAAIGRHEKNVANGHAVDAMNYYNDAVGSLGGTCRKPAKPLPEVEPERPPPPPSNVPTLDEIRQGEPQNDKPKSDKPKSDKPKPAPEPDSI